MGYELMNVDWSNSHSVSLNSLRRIGNCLRISTRRIGLNSGMFSGYVSLSISTGLVSLIVRYKLTWCAETISGSDRSESVRPGFTQDRRCSSGRKGKHDDNGHSSSRHMAVSQLRRCRCGFDLYWKLTFQSGPQCEDHWYRCESASLRSNVRSTPHRIPAGEPAVSI